MTRRVGGEVKPVAKEGCRKAADGGEGGVGCRVTTRGQLTRESRESTYAAPLPMWGDPISLVFDVIMWMKRIKKVSALVPR